jgi:DNA-directed RNA polymerase sigma subunit (sigma70/sigma32)
MSATLNFKPKQASKVLIGALSVRSRDVMIKRYGLGKDAEPMTLDAIGKT